MRQQIECKTTTTAPQDVKDCTGVALKFLKLTKKKKKKKKKKKIPLLCHHTSQKLKGTLWIRKKKKKIPLLCHHTSQKLKGTLWIRKVDATATSKPLESGWWCNKKKFYYCSLTKPVMTSGIGGPSLINPKPRCSSSEGKNKRTCNGYWCRCINDEFARIHTAPAALAGLPFHERHKKLPWEIGRKLVFLSFFCGHLPIGGGGGFLVHLGWCCGCSCRGGGGEQLVMVVNFLESGGNSFPFVKALLCTSLNPECPAVVFDPVPPLLCSSSRCCFQTMIMMAVVIAAMALAIFAFCNLECQHLLQTPVALSIDSSHPSSLWQSKHYSLSFINGDEAMAIVVVHKMRVAAASSSASCLAQMRIMIL